MLFFMTFLFAYLFSNLWENIYDLLHFLINKIKYKKLKKFLKHIFSFNTIVAFVYIWFVFVIVFAISSIVPKILKELTTLPETFSFLWDRIVVVRDALEQIKNFERDFQWTITKLMTEKNFEILVKFFENIKSVGSVILNLFLSLVLSFVFIIDKDKIQDFLKWAKAWNFKFIYQDYAFFASKINKWFWSIFKAQALISTVNTILTILWLYLIWFLNWWQFPYIFTLAIFVFIFWFVPVLWTFLSSVPIIAVWYSFWWLEVVLWVVLMVVFVHTMEAYILNPKIFSSYMELPVFLTFMILIISEHLFGILWLLIWVPVFYIVLDLIKDFDVYITNIRHTYRMINKMKEETKCSLNTDIRLSRSGKRWEI